MTQAAASLPFYARLIIVLVLVMVASQFAPEPINYVLLLVLVGVLLYKSDVFGSLIQNSFNLSR